ncbi:hypothetical protein LIER_28333 [Lithospermum erythrorhizon]|uniref:Transmembrane protein n=1 Tax=Lithospermum erythrorhizon TaxID=34254 RepID=A0AAV3RJH2_LITER
MLKIRSRRVRSMEDGLESEVHQVNEGSHWVPIDWFRISELVQEIEVDGLHHILNLLIVIVGVGCSMEMVGAVCICYGEMVEKVSGALCAIGWIPGILQSLD